MPRKKIEEKKQSDESVLIITEKPQAAEKISFALSEGKSERIKNKNGVSYFKFNRDGKTFFVGCAAGHLFILSQKINSFPCFDLEWVPSYKKSAPFTKKFFDVLKELSKKSTSYIIATDFDIEGEVIGWNILRFIIGNEADKKAKRMKFSSLTKEELKSSFENLLPTINWGDAVAGETRHYLDWYYGINLSRALMKSLKESGNSFKVLSIGRVQGPALNLVYQRELEIQNFKPIPYWKVFITSKDEKGNLLELEYPQNLFEEKELSKFEILKGQKGYATTVLKESSLPPPIPFDLTTLQMESYKLFGLSPSQTLKIAQNLYLEGLISYPRTSSQKLPNINFKEILKRIRDYTELVNYAIKEKPTEGKKTDPAHPAIYPTGYLKKLEGNEKKVYDLIVRRFISCFCEPAIISKKKVTVKILNIDFVAEGSSIIKRNWLNVYPSSFKEKEIPSLEGEVNIKEIRIEEKQTQPPARYNSASLVRELEKRNLGTKATRAMIVETLYERNYIKNNPIEITPLGKKIVESLMKYSPIILDEQLTRNFEEEMEKISQEKEGWFKHEEIVLKKARDTISEIISSLNENLIEIGNSLSEANSQIIEEDLKERTLTLCPICKKGNLRISFNKKAKRYFISCSNYPDCKITFSLPPNSLIKPSKDERGEIEMCPNCKEFPLLLSLKKGKKPWKFCFNPSCPSRE
ncbi:MAG: DNA topoisomerase I [Candidatus Pacearchaeota archaeon]